MDSEATNEKQYVDIFPLSKWKRVLVFLADFFLTYIISLLLFNIMVMPLAKVISNYDTRLNNENLAVERMHGVLYKNKVLFQSPDYSYDNITANINYSFNVWLSYQCLDEEASMDEKYPQYGHKEENELLYHFYNDIRNDGANYLSLFKIYNDKDKYFTLNEMNRFILNDKVKNEVKYYFDPRSDMSSTGQTYYNNIKNNVFAPMLSEVFTNIEKNDLTFEGISYIENHKIHLAYSNFRDTLITVTSFVTLGLSWIIYHVIIPLINKNRKTLAMMMMSIERVNTDRLYICKRKEMILPSLYAFLTNMMSILFIPIMFVNFNYLFSLLVLLIFTVVSLGFNLISLIFVLFNSFNRALSDIFSRSVMITTKNLDEIYRARGYNF